MVFEKTCAKVVPNVMFGTNFFVYTHLHLHTFAYRTFVQEIFLSFGVLAFLPNLKNARGLLWCTFGMRP
jgi:hypothetical protein